MSSGGSRSRKPSAASSRSRPPEPLVFFLDRSLGKRKVASALRASGLSVVVHDDIFPPDARDEEWLPVVGARNWVVLTKDRRIRYRAIERMALLAGGVRAFVVTGRGLHGDEIAVLVVRSLPAIRRLLGRHGGPFIAAVRSVATVQILVEGR